MAHAALQAEGTESLRECVQVEFSKMLQAIQQHQQRQGGGTGLPSGARREPIASSSSQSSGAPSSLVTTEGRVTIDKDLQTVRAVFDEWIKKSSNPHPLSYYYDLNKGFKGWRDGVVGDNGANRKYWNDTRRPILKMIASMVNPQLYHGKYRGDVDAFIANVRYPVDALIEQAVNRLSAWQSRDFSPAKYEAPLRVFAVHYKGLGVDQHGNLPDLNAIIGV